MKIRILIILVCLFPLFGQSQTQWIKHKSEIGKYSIAFPSKPIYQYNNFHGWTASDQDGRVTYLLSYIDSPEGAKTTYNILEKYLLPALLEGDIKITQSRKIIHNSEAVEFTYRTNQNPYLYKKGVAINRNNDIYVLMIQYYEEDLIEYEKYVNSLKFK